MPLAETVEVVEVEGVYEAGGAEDYPVLLVVVVTFHENWRSLLKFLRFCSNPTTNESPKGSVLTRFLWILDSTRECGFPCDS